MSEKEANELITKDQVRKTISDNFYYLRTQLGLSVKGMSDHLGISRQNLQAVEEMKSMAPDIVINMAKFCNISLDTIFLTNLGKEAIKNER